MKKIYLLTLATLFAGAVSAQRSLDLSLTLTDPVEASTVPQTTNQNLDFEVSNLGDDLIENDTIVLYLYNATTQEQYSMAGQLQGQVNIVPLTGPTLAVAASLNGGGTLTPTMLGGIELDLTAAGFNVGDHIFVAVDIWGANGETEEQATFADNIGSFTIGATTSLTINTKDIKVYPNPANDFVNFKVDGLENGTITINSITGQEVVNASISGTEKVNVNHLNNGVYIYTVRNANGEVVKTNKLIIRK